MDILLFIIRFAATLMRSTFRETWSDGQSDVVMMGGGTEYQKSFACFADHFTSLYQNFLEDFCAALA